jgi:long-chain acyl-CoA synthetase
LFPSDPIAHHAANRPGEIGLHFESERFTWAALEESVRRASAFLDDTLPAGATVLLQGWNDPLFIILREAIYRTGRAYGAISPQASAKEIDHLLRLTQADLFLREADGQPHNAGNSGPKTLDWRTPLSRAPRQITDRRDQARTLLFTSGTTGLPKACVRPVSADQSRIESMVKTFRLRAEQNHLVATPLYHSGPTIFQRTHMALGSTTFLDRKFNPEAVWQHAAAAEAHTAFFVPTHYHRLLHADSGLPAQNIEAWWIAGAPASAALKQRIIQRIGPGRLWEFLGSSETGTMAVMAPEEHLARPGSVGKPPPGVSIRILDETGAAMPAGETGLIYVFNHMLMAGYLGEDGSAALWTDGYLSVGDIGHLDADGYLYLSDRRTDLIISGGVNVYPAEVEAVLESYPGIHEACVVGTGDEEWGARVVAVLVADASFHPEDPGAVDAFAAFLRTELAPAKRPKHWEFWNEIPHNAIGKPLRTEVRRRLAMQAPLTEGG